MLNCPVTLIANLSYQVGQSNFSRVVKCAMIFFIKMIKYPRNCYCRLLELESSGRRDEIRLHYLHEGQIRTETLPYRLADNRWHLVALGFSAHHCILYIDCNKVRPSFLPIHPLIHQGYPSRFTDQFTQTNSSKSTTPQCANRLRIADHELDYP